MNILLISHSADRTGAPIGLLEFARWLSTIPDVTAATIVRGHGPLVQEFAEAVPTLSLNNRWSTVLPRQVRTHVRPASRAIARLTKRLGGIDVVLSNTVTNGAVLRSLPKDVPVVTFAHELENSSRMFTTASELAYTLDRTCRFVVPAQAVADFYVERHGVPEGSIQIVREFIAVDACATAHTRSSARRALGLSEDFFVVGDCGTADWRKGSDLFILLAREFARVGSSPPSFAFVWIGGRESDVQRAEHDSSRLGLSDSVRFVRARADARDLFAAFDVFALTSREDPYPLVMLEAACLGLPVVGFESSGGFPEYAAGGAGVVVPYMDMKAMADAISALQLDADLRRQVGERGRAKVMAENSTEYGAARLLEVLCEARTGSQRRSDTVMADVRPTAASFDPSE